MATKIYKDGDSKLVNYDQLQRHIDAGWQFDNAPVKVSKADIDTNNSGKLSVDEVRAAAKEAGIDGWEKKRIKTLLKELGHGDEKD